MTRLTEMMLISGLAIVCGLQCLVQDVGPMALSSDRQVLSDLRVEGEDTMVAEGVTVRRLAPEIKHEEELAVRWAVEALLPNDDCRVTYITTTRSASVSRVMLSAAGNARKKWSTVLQISLRGAFGPDKESWRKFVQENGSIVVVITAQRYEGLPEESIGVLRGKGQERVLAVMTATVDSVRQYSERENKKRTEKSSK